MMTPRTSTTSAPVPVAARTRRTPSADSRSPTPSAEGGRPSSGEGGGPPVDYLYEPSPEEIFKDLLPRHVQVQVYRALLESAASEHGARMTAMRNASKNAGELIDQLAGEPSLAGYHLLPSVRGDLLVKLGRHAEAQRELERAAALTRNGRERTLLLARAARCAGAGSS